MSQGKTQHFRWTDVRGVNLAMDPSAIPKNLVTAINNVELMPGAIGRRRPALSAFVVGPGANQTINSLFRFIAADGIDSIWHSSSGTSETLHFRKSGSTTTITPGDAATSFANGISYAALKNKLFVAYDSAVNRLHVYDGTNFRRVGLSTPNAPTVADTGAGAYAATPRRYRVSMRIVSGSDVVVESELSSAVSFTPSGAGTAARVTKPTTVDSATHWVVWGLISSSGDTYGLYENISGNIAVGTTTFDDSVNPSAYDGAFPSTLGLHMTPPSARFLLATDNRLFMAGAFESSGGTSGGETKPQDSRVWFSRVLGASDNGDDETIPNTTSQFNKIDVGEGDGDKITGIAGPCDGVIYVFKSRSIWALQPTGDPDVPYTAQRVTSAVGSYLNALDSTFGTHNAMLVAEDTIGSPVVYFPEGESIYRISPRSGIERVNEDITPALDGSSPFVYRYATYWSARRMLLFCGETIAGLERVIVYVPRLAFRDDIGIWRGGWTVWDVNNQFGGAARALCTTIIAGDVVPLLAGSGPTAVAAAGTFSANNSVQQDADCRSGGGGAASNVDASLTSAPIRAAERNRMSLYSPEIEAAVTTGATPTVSYVRDFGTETRAATAPALTAVGAETRVFVDVEGLELADASVAQIKYAWDTDQFGTSELTSAITIPMHGQEAR